MISKRRTDKASGGDRVLHHVHHADPTIERTKRSVVTYRKARQPIAVWNVMTLALELNRRSDGTCPWETFEEAASRAFEICAEYQRRLDVTDSAG